jgi:hypothetical protein
MTEIVCAAITAFAGVMVAVFSARMAKTEARSEEKADLRQQESLLSLKMMNATLDLSKENSIGILSGNNFENIQDALDRANSVSKEYQEFLQEVTAHEVGR